MITPDYVRRMARYNAWQQEQLLPVLHAAPDTVLTRGTGAFFGSVLGTLNHLLWGDTLWMSRFDARVEVPAAALADSARLHDGLEGWAAARQEMDGAIARWAGDIGPAALGSVLSWYSGIMKADVTRPMADCVVHMFNHQTHHRGQVHAMLTQAGLKAPVLDLFFLPEDA